MKLLFICTHNRCRSILSEAITNQRARGILTAASAGSAP
ncbi:MAG: arsenate reductase ArsC, partial [Pseudomonadota bacterium]|nr:arsenate reductase ArsC [Pseudomonadota bacterium]